MKRCGSLEKVPSCPSVTSCNFRKLHSQIVFDKAASTIERLLKHPSTLINHASSLRKCRPACKRRAGPIGTMITDDGLYRLAVFLGSAAMLLIVLYHFLEVNSVDEPESDNKPIRATSAKVEKATSSTR